MASDYARIREENEKRYGTDIGRIGPMLLSERYADRTHFIFELLQNAEDALARRTGSYGPRAVKFHLANGMLRVSHYGKPFDEDDVRAICGIALSTKNLNAIGRFGIGFKSVYAFSDRPEIHSGAEDFVIENFVWPAAAPPVERAEDETVILLPLKTQDKQASEEITRGFRRLGPRTLLFLRHIEEIEWHVEGGPSGYYLRSTQDLDDGLRRITVIGEEQGKPDMEEIWLVFSRQVMTNVGNTVGCVEIAFTIAKEGASNQETIVPVKDSPLVVFFPTVLETHLGFLVQGPYRTTPSRDNVPRIDPWNQHLVKETATLLIDALRWLRDHDLLNAAVLRCLPLVSMKFGEETMFAPLFEATKHALMTEPLLPRFDSGYVQGSKARLARTQELRELFTPKQLATLFRNEGELVWLSGDITQDRTPELRQYLIHELEITEITPETIVPRLDKEFLEAQPDQWILKLYEFLNGQPALQRRLSAIPIVRLADGQHVTAWANDQPQAFLPGEKETSFPTVRAAVCATEESRGFLKSLGLTEPDPVDDVVWNLLPKYGASGADVSDTEYEADMRRILAAFETDSKTQRQKLLSALRDTAFVRVIDSGNGSKGMSKPGEVYLTTERLKELLTGVPGVLFVDDSYPCLRGEKVRELLEACGATRYLRPIEVASTFTEEQLCELRIKETGSERISQHLSIDDHTLHGLDGLLELLPALDESSRAKRAKLLWEALDDLEERRGPGIFSGRYRWFYYKEHNTSFDAAFVRRLNETAWVPGVNGQLERPEFVVFDTLGWVSNPFLQHKIRFKPPIIETLAKEAGIEVGVLDLLKKLGVTTEAELRSKLGLPETEPTQPEPGSGPQNINEAVEALLGSNPPAPTPPIPYASNAELQELVAARTWGSGGETYRATGAGDSRAPAPGTGAHETYGGVSKAPIEEANRIVGSPGRQRFISYVGVHPHAEEPDPDGLDHTARMALEEKAISFILQFEPKLQRTPAYNPGFDLFEPGPGGQPVRWVEVKAMTGSMHDRPVGLSRAQFDCAREHGTAYWLYVVEHAAGDRACIRRIQDPAGRAQSFTFDHGWLAVAEVDREQEDIFNNGLLAVSKEGQEDIEG